MTSVVDNGIVHLAASRSVDEVLEHLLSILQTKGITLFAVVDHSGEAAKVGFEMRPTKLVIFGNPKAGTPLMIAAPDSALDLPLKILIAGISTLISRSIEQRSIYDARLSDEQIALRQKMREEEPNPIGVPQ